MTNPVEAMARAIDPVAFLEANAQNLRLMDGAPLEVIASVAESRRSRARDTARAALQALKDKVNDSMLSEINKDVARRLDCTCHECVGRVMDGEWFVKLTVMSFIDTAMKEETDGD